MARTFAVANHYSVSSKMFLSRTFRACRVVVLPTNQTERIQIEETNDILDSNQIYRQQMFAELKKWLVSDRSKLFDFFSETLLEI